jgi:hypothetical protein
MRSLSLLLTLFVGLAAVVAQEQPKKSKDPQSSFEPPSAPGAGQKFLEKFVGDWEVAKTFYPKSGAPFRVTGDCRQTMIHEGRFLKSEFVFNGPGGKTTGTGTIGYESASGMFTSVWVDSRATRMSFRQGQEKFNGEEIILFGKSLDGAVKGTGRSRTNTRLEADGARIIHRQFTIDAEGKERLIMELILTRKQQGASQDSGPSSGERPLTPEDARHKVGEPITVQMQVRAAKDRLEKHGEIYLDAELDFRDKNNFAVVIKKAGATSLKARGIDNPAEYYRDKTIRATGTVKTVDGVPRIEIDDAKQISVVSKS